MASAWNDDDRAPLKALRTCSSDSTTFDDFDLGKMLKSIIDEERDKLYVTSATHPSMRRHSSCGSIQSLDQSISSFSDSEYPEFEETVSVDYTDDEEHGSDATVQPEHDAHVRDDLAKIIEDQVYKKFGYV